MEYPYRIDSELINTLDEELERNPEKLVRALDMIFRADPHVMESSKEVCRKIASLKKIYPDVDVDLLRSIVNLPSTKIYSLIMFGLAPYKHRGSLGLQIS